MKTKLSIREEFVVIYWMFFDIWKFDAFEYWVSVGVKPKYAYQKAKNRE